MGWENPLGISPEGQKVPHKLDVPQEQTVEGCPHVSLNQAGVEEDQPAEQDVFAKTKRGEKKSLLSLDEVADN